MSGPRELSPAGYARRIEGLWSELLQRPLVLSPRDWSLVLEWHASRIPLEIVREALEAAAERESRGPRKRPLRGLGYLAPAVSEAWRVVVAGRIADVTAGESAEPSRSVWRRRLRAEPTDSPLYRLLSGLLTRLERGEPPAELDLQLERELPGAVPRSLVEAVRGELERELAPYRDRMSAERFDETLARAAVARLRMKLRLPRLSAGEGQRGR